MGERYLYLCLRVAGSYRTSNSNWCKSVGDESHWATEWRCPGWGWVTGVQLSTGDECEGADSAYGSWQKSRMLFDILVATVKIDDLKASKTSNRFANSHWLILDWIIKRNIPVSRKDEKTWRLCFRKEAPSKSFSGCKRTEGRGQIEMVAEHWQHLKCCLKIDLYTLHFQIEMLSTL